MSLLLINLIKYVHKLEIWGASDDKLFDELPFESISIIPLAKKKKKKFKQARIKLIHKAKGMDVAVITVNTSGQKVSSTSALGLYNGSAPRDIKGEA